MYSFILTRLINHVFNRGLTKLILCPDFTVFGVIIWKVETSWFVLFMCLNLCSVKPNQTKQIYYSFHA